MRSTAASASARTSSRPSRPGFYLLLRLATGSAGRVPRRGPGALPRGRARRCRRRVGARTRAHRRGGRPARGRSSPRGACVWDRVVPRRRRLALDRDRTGRSGPARLVASLELAGTRRRSRVRDRRLGVRQALRGDGAGARRGTARRVSTAPASRRRLSARRRRCHAGVPCRVCRHDRRSLRRRGRVSYRRAASSRAVWARTPSASPSSFIRERCSPCSSSQARLPGSYAAHDHGCSCPSGCGRLRRQHSSSGTGRCSTTTSCSSRRRALSPPARRWAA